MIAPSNPDVARARSDLRASGVELLAASAAWLLSVAGCIALAWLYLPAVIDGGIGDGTTLSIVELVPVLLWFASLGWLLVRLRPGHAVGWLFLLAPPFGAAPFVGFGIVALAADTMPALAGAAGTIAIAGLVVFTVLLLAFLPVLFPDGRLPGPGWRAPVAALTGLLIVSTAATILGPGQIDPGIPPNPLAIPFLPDWTLPAGTALAVVVMLLGAIMGVVSIVVRFRRGRGDERQQLKWMLAAVVLSGMTVLPTFVGVSSALLTVVGPFAIALIPAAVTLAILRYRLYDIDRLISRSIAYALVTVVVVATFVVGNLALQAALANVTSGETLAVAGSTLVGARRLPAHPAMGPGCRRPALRPGAGRCGRDRRGLQCAPAGCRRPRDGGRGHPGDGERLAPAGRDRDLAPRSAVGRWRARHRRPSGTSGISAAPHPWLVDDGRLGARFRVLRHRFGWRQVDVGARAGLSQDVISLIENGRLEDVSVRALRRVARVLGGDLRIDLWFRGGELDRLMDEGHAALVGAVARRLEALGWETRPEVSFAVFAERGSIDLASWHAASRTLLVIEVKTELTSIEETLRRHDAKVRLAADVVAERFGWRPVRVARLLVLPDATTPRRQVRRHDPVLRSAYPMRGHSLRTWLRSPAGSAAGLAFVPPTTNRRAAGGPVSRRRISGTRVAAAPHDQAE